MQFSEKQSRIEKGMGTDLRRKRDLVDQPKNHVLVKVVSSWRTGTASGFQVYTQHRFSTTYKETFHIYQLSESVFKLVVSDTL